MTAATAIPATIEQLETAIQLDVVTRLTKLREATFRFSLLVKFEGQPTWQALGNLTGRNMIRNQAIGKPTEEEEYLPTASAFECCGNSEFRDKAKSATRFQEPANDISVMFRHDPHAHMINTILKKCVVDRQQKCVGIHDVRAMVIAFVSLIQHGGQLLQKEVPRSCHVCGDDKYQPQTLQQNVPIGDIRIWTGGSDTVKLTVQTFACDKCGHVEFFKTAPQ